MKTFLIILLGIGFTNCSTKKTSSQSGKEWTQREEKTTPTQRSLNLAFSRIKKRKSSMERALASSDARPIEMESMVPRIRSLAQPFEVLVLEKKSDITEKTNHKDDFFDQFRYRRHMVYSFTALRISSCYKLAKENSKKWRARKYFGGPEKFEKNKRRKCLIMRVKKTYPKLKRSLIRVGDVLKMRIYMDDSFRPYGKEFLIATRANARISRREYKVISQKLDGQGSLFSGLTTFPIDLPNFSERSTTKNWNYYGSDVLELPLSPQVNKLIKKKVHHALCKDGYRTFFEDPYGGTVRVGWCLGHAWPTTIETGKYFAVLRRGALNF